MSSISIIITTLALLRLAEGYYMVHTPSVNTTGPLEGFVSFSIEFSSFPDFAGKQRNNSYPNTFSDNLLTNIGNIIGTKPYIRVGGNTQDYAIYNASLPYALNGTFNLSRSADYPTTIEIGPSYFESYNTWNNTKFSHGFNLALEATTEAGWQTLVDTVPLACKALGKDKLYWWEYGNEADLYSTSAQGATRPSTWNESTYVAQWQNGTAKIKALLQQHCPDLASNSSYGLLAPSFAGTSNHLKAPLAWQDGLNSENEIRLFGTHKYASWQPINTNKTTIGTKAPYYAHIAVAAFLGDLSTTAVTVASIPLSWTSDQEAAYAVYRDNGRTLARIMVINLGAYNTTVDGAGLERLPAGEETARPAQEYSFYVAPSLLPASAHAQVGVRRLTANGSDAITGITFDGWSFNYELDEGRPVRLSNVTVGETVTLAEKRTVNVQVPYSSAVILDFDVPHVAIRGS